MPKEPIRRPIQRRYVTSERAFSAIEILLTTVIGLMIAGVMIVFLFASQSGVAAINGPASLQVQMATATSTLAQDVHFVNGLTGAPDWSSLDDGQDDGQANLTLVVAAIDGNGQTLPSQSDQITYDFSRTTGQLQRTVVASPGSGRVSGTQVLARNLVSVVFTVTPALPPALGDLRLDLTGQWQREGGHVFTFTLSSRSASRM